MPSSLYARYVWLIDTIKRRGRITRGELDRLWRLSPHGTGNALCRRTLYNYRAAIQEIFGIDIQCDPATYEYYIAEEDHHNTSVTDWLLNSGAVSDALASARDISGRIFLEDIPSAREFLGTVIDALPLQMILVPILLPAVLAYGINPIQFGVVVIFNLMIGILTPPMGTALFVVSRVGNMQFKTLVKGVLPFLIPLIITLILLNVFPQITLFLPTLLTGGV